MYFAEWQIGDGSELCVMSGRFSKVGKYQEGWEGELYKHI
uniref:Uncharacterized protein n=1 Tax=Anguilla anguilla TaxID=7936 RepID=A0A0E9SBL1_ANGAN